MKTWLLGVTRINHKHAMSRVKCNYFVTRSAQTIYIILLPMLLDPVELHSTPAPPSPSHPSPTCVQACSLTPGGLQWRGTGQHCHRYQAFMLHSHVMPPIPTHPPRQKQHKSGNYCLRAWFLVQIPSERETLFSFDIFMQVNFLKNCKLFLTQKQKHTREHMHAHTRKHMAINLILHVTTLHTRQMLWLKRLVGCFSRESASTSRWFRVSKGNTIFLWTTARTSSSWRERMVGADGPSSDSSINESICPDKYPHLPPPPDGIHSSPTPFFPGGRWHFGKFQNQ